MENLPNPNQEIIVVTDDWAFARPDENKNLVTKGALPCVVIAIHSQQGSYLGHFSDPTTSIDEVTSVPGDKVLDEMIEDIKGQINPAEAEVWLGGASPSSDEYDPKKTNPNEYAEKTFQNFGYTKKKLLKLGFKENNIFEAMSGHDEVVDVVLDPVSGRISINTEKQTVDPSFYSKQEYWDFKSGK